MYSKSVDLAIRRSDCNKSLCLFRSNYFVRCISLSIKRIFLKLHFTYRTLIWYSRSTFVVNRSVNKDTLLEEPALSWRCLGCGWRVFPINSHLSLYVNFMKTLCGCFYRIKIKLCHLKSCVTGRLYLG